MMEKEIRDIIFISHANPSDNDFTKWLSLKLISFGYNVWCDILSLDKGKAIWHTIEKIIRTNTCKFLVVLSETSNTSDGVLNEIAVANKVKKELSDDTFLIPLLIDEKLSFDKINIELNRLNAIDFRSSWATGLKELYDIFDKNNLLKTEDGYYNTNNIYREKFLKGKRVIKRDDLYHTNWFPIESLPQNLYFHSINVSDITNLLNIFPYPFFEYKNYICTLSEDIGNFPSNSELFENSRKITIPILNILDRSYNTDFASNNDCRNFLIRLFNASLNNMFKNNNFRQYELSGNKIGYWFEINQLKNNKLNGIKLVGDFRAFKWHYGATSLIKLFPFPMLVLTSHIFFTNDGKNLVESKPKQHKYRKRLGATWYNNIWMQRMYNFVNYLANTNNEIHIPVGNKEEIIVSSTSIKFPCNISYFTPKENSHIDDVDFSTFDIIDDEEDEFIMSEDDSL